jgi:hypothetical protein
MPCSLLASDWSGWSTARWAPAVRAASRRSSKWAPDICTTSEPALSPPPDAILSQTFFIAPSGVVIKTISAFDAAFTTSVAGVPAPIKAAAFSADTRERAATAVTVYPARVSRKPTAQPTRPAPMMAMDFGVISVYPQIAQIALMSDTTKIIYYFCIICEIYGYGAAYGINLSSTVK